MRQFWFIAVICMLFLFSNCSTTDSGSVHVGDTPHERLSEYHFFTGELATLTPNEGVLPYDLNSPLFSDYAHKARFVWMPQGTSASYKTDHVLEFPVGTVLIKNFFYNNDETDLSKGRRILETRILINRGDEWEGLGYTWNEEQTDAEYNLIGDIKDVSWVNESGRKINLDYIIPNKNQCKSCHAYDNVSKPIGPKVRNLNKDFTYDDGPKNQLVKWQEVGYLTGLDTDAVHPAVAVWDNKEDYGLHERALAYLDINCGHCHNPKGAANTSGLTLEADSEMGLSLGVYKATVSAGAGTGGHTYSIVPGNPEESIMIYRMKSNNPGAMMPELGRRLIHTEGVALIAEWIRNMDEGETGDAPGATLN